MNKLTQQGATSRHRLLKMVEKEIIEFEERERAFRKKDREERAAELLRRLQNKHAFKRYSALIRLANTRQRIGV
jgi:hypothetical protein